MPPDRGNRVVGWLEQEQPTGPVPLELATRAAAAETHAEAAQALTGTFAQAGDNRHTLASPSRDIVTARSAGEGGNSAAYLAARLKKAGRDDLLLMQMIKA